LHGGPTICVEQLNPIISFVTFKLFKSGHDLRHSNKDIQIKRNC
jgi:hypothetical protein